MTPWRRSRLVALLLLLAWLAGAGPGAARAGEAPPWRLALVVDCSEGMTQPWLGSTRLEMLEPALQSELLSLPLRVRAGVWLVGGGPGQAREFLAPRPAAEFRDTNLVLPRLEGAADLAAGIKLAMAWLKDQGPGALVVISGAGSRLPAAAPATASGGQGPFCHALALGPEEATQKDLQELALQGGASYFRAMKADQAAPLLRGAMLTALSPASLLVLAHGQDNRPLSITYGLTRRDLLALEPRGASGRPCQLLPGVYQMSWPAGIGPATPPAKVSVAVSGQTRLWAGGTGSLKVKALDPQGQELPWVASVANLETGKVEVPEKRTPYQATLPAGVYRVKVQRPPLTWTLELGAGRQVELVTGPQGSLNLTLSGPSGPWRVPYHLEDRLGLRPAGTGYTNSPLPLLPGQYRLRAEVVPPWRQEFTLAPGQDLSLAMPLLGAILVRRDKAGLSQPFQVLDSQDRLLGAGVSDRPLPTQAGTYRLHMPQQGATLEVEVKAGQLTALDPPKGPGAH
ncbi:MAG: VWA domain-containing protein [Desulfarculus sp.]|nr:VWA domain-containing protein [Desulfarculus sp.]